MSHYAASSRRGMSADQALVRHAHALLFPFQTDEWNPTLDTPIPSQKIRCFSRTQVTTSNNDGWGWVSATPNIAQDTMCMQVYSGAGAANSFGSGSLRLNNSRFTANDFNGGSFYGRISCCAIRVRNITPLDTRGGTLHLLRSPVDLPLTGPFDDLISQLEPIGYSREGDAISSDWQTMVWIPRDPDQTQYRASPYAPQFVIGSNVTDAMAMVFKAPSNNLSQTYEIEYVCWGEVIDSNAASTALHHTSRNQMHHLSPTVTHVISGVINTDEHVAAKPHRDLARYVVQAVKFGQDARDVIMNAGDMLRRGSAIAAEAWSAVKSIF